MAPWRHRLAGRDDEIVEFDLDVSNVIAYEDGLAVSWDMFTTADEAQARFDALTAR